MGLRLNNMINNLFSIPVWKNSLNIDPDIKEDLLNQITQNYEKHEDYIHPNWGSKIHSTIKDHNNINYDQIMPFYRKEYENFVSEKNLNLYSHNYWLQKPWYNYYVKHSGQEIHSHVNVNAEDNKFIFFSAVYFLKLNKNHPKITFYNPNTYSITSGQSKKIQSYFNTQNINHSFQIRFFTLDVEEDDLIIFPSSLEHAVFQQKVDDPRITITFNIKSEWN
jgi:hypothetical protein